MTACFHVSIVFIIVRHQETTVQRLSGEWLRRKHMGRHISMEWLILWLIWLAKPSCIGGQLSICVCNVTLKSSNGTDTEKRRIDE